MEISRPSPFPRGIAVRISEYKSGDKVQISGIYDVLHDQNHHEPHQVTAVRGEPFPPCKCGKGATFKLKYEADHLSQHPLMKH
jgi:hypothetical protein